MAGVVAMAAVIEDFEATQPCKKSKKEDDPPPTRTITNYFMPLPRSVEKPFSPPRSNNIMDYFKKTSPAQEKPGKDSSQKNTPVQSTECHEGSVKSGRAQRHKRTRKYKEQNKLQEEQRDVLTDNCAVMETPSECLVEGGGGGICISGNDAAASSSLVNSDITLDEESLDESKNTESCANDQTIKDAIPSCKSKILDNETQEDVNIAYDSASSREDKGRGAKSVGRKSKKVKASQSELCNDEHDQSLCDASLEVHADEPSELTCSTITVSFEEFLQSQKDEVDAAVPEPDTSVVDALSSTNSGSDAVLEAPQVSPRTLTVLAEVHPISSNIESDKASELRIASIFSRNKKESQTKNLKTSPSTNPSDVLPDLKRKSNVVLHEDDLELFVVESSSSPKCTKEERKQFMNAFKQPGVDGAKGKNVKGLGTPKQAQEKALQTEEKDSEEKIVVSKPDVTLRPSMEGKCSSSEGKKSKKDSTEDVSLSFPKQEELSTTTEGGLENGQTDESNMSTARELRRSSRECTRRLATPVKATPKRNPSSGKTRSLDEAEDSTAPQNDPAQASTPRTHRPKKSVYRAEMLHPLGKRESPIRMKFTRVFPSSATKAGEFEISSPLSVLESNSLKKRKHAKRLVQKAKALKHTRESADTPPVRRSARRKESVKTNYCEDEDSVLFLGDLSSIVPTSEENQKTLRSLNDVLGKKIPQSKTPRKATASKLAPIFLEKKPQRLSDDSSYDGIENSQDDEQFKAKREFLKSGLPESFKKKIAKTAANIEAYTQACASFQPVVHIQQRLMDCSMWALPWPESPLLSCLKEFYCLPSMPVVSLEGLAHHPTLPAQRPCREKVSGRQEDFTEGIRQLLLDEIGASNPSFPAQRFFTKFLKKHKDYSLQLSAELECCAVYSASANDCAGAKRKRTDEEERIGKQAKKRKSSPTGDEAIVILDSPDSNHVETQEAADAVTSRRAQRRRSLRHRQAEGETKSVELSTLEKVQSAPADSSTAEIAGAEDGVREDVLWTEKFQPEHSSEIVGNMASVRKVHSWLKEWKLRADREERRKQQEKKQGDDSNDSWLGDDGIEELEEAEDQLCNTLLITGPTGVGKTAAVYACAQELGFKVFEVNCSSQRSGRQILSQLKEATQSHQVDIQGIGAHKPTYFNSYSTGGSASKLCSSPRKVNSPRRVVSSPRKPPQSPRGATLRKGGLVPTSLATFFKMGGKPKSRDAAHRDNEAQRVCHKKSVKVTQADCKNKESDSKPSAEDQVKKTATSLILFEEVDVILDDDSGFLAAVKTFMTTTKRPVILTTSDPTFSTVFDGCFDEIHFKTPPVEHVASYLQLLCLAENVRMDPQDLVDLLRWHRCDIRQSLLHLQFWARSGGGRQVPYHTLRTEPPECEMKREAGKVKNVSACRKQLPVCLPPYHTRCTESLLGFLNVQQDQTVEALLRGGSSAVETLRSWDLLLEAERRGVNLLYTNLEVLLPLPIHPLPEPALVQDQTPGPNQDPLPDPLARHGENVEQEENMATTSPLKLSSRMRRKKHQHTNLKNALNSDSESDEGFLSFPKPSRDGATDPTPPAVRGQESTAAPVRTRSVKMDETERKGSKPVSQCLSSLAEYLDHVSFMDSALHYQPLQADGACRPQSFNWTGAEVKSGMSDDVRLERDGRAWAFDPKEIHAVLGSLSFRKCRAGVSVAWSEAQELEEQVRNRAVEELTLPVASHRQSFSLAHCTLCEPRVMEERREVLSTVFASQSLCTLGNRLAAVLDRLPSLRTICRSERLKEQGRVKRRFMHYLSAIHLDLPKSTVQQLALEFP